jgi:hypothetical protein
MDFVVLVMSRKWTMLAITLFCGVFAVAVTYIEPQTFLGEASMLPPDRLSSSGLLSKFNSGFALEMLKEVENPSVDLLQNILESRTLDERLARDSTIRSYYASEGLHGREIYEAVRKAVSVGPGFSKVDVHGTVETNWFPTPTEKEQARVLSAYIANMAISCMDSMLKSAIRSLAHSARVYADSDYALKREQLDSLDSKQQAFEQAHGVVLLEAQTTSAIDRVGELESQRDEAEIELRLIDLDLSDNASLREAAVAKLNEAEHAAMTYETDHEIGPALDSLPEVGREYAEILRDRKELEPIVSFLHVESEQQRIFEVREKSLVTVLDPARPPDGRMSPIRSQSGFLGLIVGAALSICYVAFFSLRLSWAKERNIPRDPRFGELEAASNIFARNKR